MLYRIDHDRRASGGSTSTLNESEAFNCFCSLRNKKTEINRERGIERKYRMKSEHDQLDPFQAEILARWADDVMARLGEPSVWLVT
jgi:hypothetical protein